MIYTLSVFSNRGKKISRMVIWLHLCNLSSVGRILRVFIFGFYDVSITSGCPVNTKFLPSETWRLEMGL
jgi:hypothetical protein